MKLGVTNPLKPGTLKGFNINTLNNYQPVPRRASGYAYFPPEQLAELGA